MNQTGDVAIRETVLRKEIVLFGVTNPILTLAGDWHSGERLLAGLFFVKLQGKEEDAP